jgi:phage terminase large subunit
LATLDIKHTPVFSKNFDAIQNKDIRFIVNQGGSRSSKTYSLCQLLIVYALTNGNTVISVVRKSFPALRSTVMRDFFEIMETLGIYDPNLHHKN